MSERRTAISGPNFFRLCEHLKERKRGWTTCQKAARACEEKLGFHVNYKTVRRAVDTIKRPDLLPDVHPRNKGKDKKPDILKECVKAAREETKKLIERVEERVKGVGNHLFERGVLIDDLAFRINEVEKLADHLAKCTLPAAFERIEALEKSQGKPFELSNGSAEHVKMFEDKKE